MFVDVVQIGGFHSSLKTGQTSSCRRFRFRLPYDHCYLFDKAVKM